MTTQTLTLSAFLLARLDEDEAVARAAIAHGEGSLDWGDEGDPTDRHIARHDPARVLADVESKRRIVARAQTLDEQAASLQPDHPQYASFHGQAVAWGVACAFLALPYADHPDYREDWRP